MDSIAIPWGAEVGLITWRTVRQHGRPPLPSEILASFVVFGAFSLVSAKSPQVGSLLGWGIVIATALNFFPATPTGDKSHVYPFTLPKTGTDVPVPRTTKGQLP